MSTYVIGDVHGCYDELQMLIKKIKFNKNKDSLISVSYTHLRAHET